MTIIGLIRHGSTQWNRLGKLQGQLDTDLTDEGRDQARKLGLRLKQENWHGVISSDLSRAKETAEIISELAEIPLLKIDVRLRERSFGQAEGLTVEERSIRWGESWDPLAWGGESDEAVWARWLSFSEELSHSYPKDQKILIVSHGAYIVQILKGLELEREEYLQNTSLTILQRNESAWNLLLYNCLTHLNEL
jgi:probable phosphoglycerate mutase